jgi:hypothetical protein
MDSSRNVVSKNQGSRPPLALLPSAASPSGVAQEEAPAPDRPSPAVPTDASAEPSTRPPSVPVVRSNLQGKVVMAGTRQPLDQVQVTIDGTSIQTRTAADGSLYSARAHRQGLCLLSEAGLRAH